MKETPYILANFIGILKKTEEALAEMGAERFWHGAGNKEQKAREAFIALFFILGIKKITGNDWWLLQPPGVDFPDFEIASFTGTTENPNINILHFELVTIPDRCENFQKAYSIVRGKFDKNYAISESVPVRLLVFINHVKSEEWVGGLISKIGNYKPFTEIWTAHLVFKGSEIAGVTLTKVRPCQPFLKQTILIGEKDVLQTPKLPEYVSTDENGNLIFKKEFQSEMRKRALRMKLGKT